MTTAPEASRLAAAARSAPKRPGVYFMLDGDGELLYVGKAADLRRRLGDHAREVPVDGTRHAVRFRRAETVRWEETETEEQALLREADLIVAFRPRLNAAIAGEDANRYIAVTRTDGTAEFALVSTTDEPGQLYGCFPHLAKGAGSAPAKLSKVGYTALLRLLWVVQPGPQAFRIPGRIGGTSPPVRHSAVVADDDAAALHRYLSGQSVRLVDALEAKISEVGVPQFMVRGLGRDAVAARRFFEVGPRRLRQLRLRHGVPPGPVSARDAMKALASEVEEVVGKFTCPGLRGEGPPLLGRYSRRAPPLH